MSTIELGDVSSAPRAEPVPVVLDRRLVRKLRLAAALVLCLLTVTGSTSPEPRVRLLWSVGFDDDSGSLLGTDTAYLFRTTSSGYRVDAHDLATGRLRWQREVDGAVDYGHLAEADGLLLVPADRQLVASGPDPDDGNFVQVIGATVAIDVTDGRELWRIPGELDALAVHGGAALVKEYGGRGGPARLRLVRLSDQRTMWSVDTPYDGTYSVAFAGERPDRLVTVDGEGRVAVFRYTDGARLTGGRIPWFTPDPAEEEYVGVSATGDHLVVNRRRRTRVGVTVYRMDTLTEVWHFDQPGGYSFDCGPMVCVHDGIRATAYDLATGAQRWQLTGVADIGGLLRDDRLIADDRGNPVLIETATGRRVGEPVTGAMVWNVGPVDTVYLTNPTASPPESISIARWDLSTGHADLLGVIPRVSGDGCHASGRFLGCADDHAYQVITVG